MRAQMQARVDEAVRQADWLRKQNEQLTEQLVRIQRHQSGMYETPRPDRPAVSRPPRELIDYIQGFDSPNIRKQMRDTVFRRHAQGEKWEDILREVVSEPEDSLP